jgi:acyl carrier protein
MQEAEIYAALTEIFREVFMRDDITLHPGLSAADLKDWDSYKQVEIIISVEDRYGIKFHTRELDTLANVGDLVRVVMARAK